MVLSHDGKEGLDRNAANPSSACGHPFNSAPAANSGTGKGGGLDGLPSFSAVVNSLESQDSKRKSEENEHDKIKRHKKEDEQSSLMVAMLQQMHSMQAAQSKTLEALTCMMSQVQALTSQPQSRTNTGTGQEPPAEAVPIPIPATNPQVHDALVHVVARAASEAPSRTVAQVPTEIKNIIHKTMRRAGDRIQRNLRAQKRLEAAQADIDTMQAAGRYPAGTRPFRCQSDMVELDEYLGEAFRDKYVFQIEVQQGSTRKEALAIMHHAFTKESKRINLEAMKERVEKEKLRNKREKIFEECAAAIKDATEVDKLDLDDPVNTKNIDNAIKVVQDMEYGKMIEEVRKEEQKMKEKEEKHKKRKEKEMNELKDNHPATLMRDVVNQMVAEKVHEIRKDKEEKDQEMQAEEANEEHTEHQQGQEGQVDRMCKALQKNGGALWSGGKGHWSKTSTHKGKASNKSKGKGKKGNKGKKHNNPYWHQHHQYSQKGAAMGTGKGYSSMTNPLQAGGYRRRGFGWQDGGKQEWNKSNSNKEQRGSWN